MLRYSAVLTTYNADATINVALDAILKQDVAPAEIIVIDDNSFDRTFEKVSAYQVKYPQIRFYQNPGNLGVSSSRNFAVKIARQNYVIFFDDDDVSLENRARIHMEHFLYDVDVSYVSSSKKYVNGYTVSHKSKEYIGSLDPSEFARRQLLGGGNTLLATPASCMAIKRELALQIGGFDSELRRLEDIDLAIRLSISNAKFAFSSQVCVQRLDLGKLNSEFEGLSQKIILLKHQNLLTSSQFREAAFKVAIHDLYFKRRLFELFFRILVQITIHPKQVRYLFVGLKRLKHDWSKK